MKRFFLLTSLAVGLTVLNLGGPAGCGASVQCGDGVIGGSEVCDGGALGGESCESQGFSPEGTLACASDCGSFDTSGCVDSGTLSGLVGISGDQDDSFSSFQLLPDFLGNLYVGGIYSSSTTLTVGDKSIAGLGGVQHNFAAKVNPDGTVAWLNGFQGNGTSSDQGGFLVLDASGDAFFYGLFNGTTLAAPGRTVSNVDVSGMTGDGYGGRLKPDGSIDWIDAFASADGDQMYFYSDPATGNLYVSGFFAGPTLTLGSKTLTNGGAVTSEIYVARIDPANGSFVWVTHFSSDSNDSGFPVLDDSGNLYVIGSFWGAKLAVNGTNRLTNASAGSQDAYVARLDPADGNLLWITPFSSNNFDFLSSNTATDSEGNLYVRGQFTAVALTAGTKTLSNADGSGTTQDAFVAKINPSDGSVAWLTGVASAKNDTVTLAPRADGGIYVGGAYLGATLALGGKSLTNADSSGATSDSFLARLDPADGTALWLTGFSDDGNQFTTPLVTTAPSGDVYFDSGFSGKSLTASGKTFANGNPAGGSFDSFIGKFAPDGTPAWIVSFPGGDQDGVDLVTDASGRLPSNRLYVSGSFRGPSFSLGGQTLANADASGTTYDALVGGLDPTDGSILWVLPIQSDKDDSAFLVPDDAGRVYFGGRFKGSSVTLQGETLTNADSSGTTNDAFVGRIAP